MYESQRLLWWRPQAWIPPLGDLDPRVNTTNRMSFLNIKSNQTSSAVLLLQY